MKRNVYVGAVILLLVVALGIGSVALEKRAAVQAAGVQAPMFEVDPMWPKPLPNHWLRQVRFQSRSSNFLEESYPD